ncbi:MAG: M48 family metalloprotease [Betaproteobacteria bacterium]|nr:M48 family metalloprotease [Betaproteobacteria bacterium]MDE2124802.1 M48 family metalloprotease [Betaproteobacteria bacterium]MDE2187309.1 M48 family metalloprotease [Betaproteobacteria bacterium]MDE2323457.1 M48 family metalloprotease [Betaproteobacteria bacterium]
MTDCAGRRQFLRCGLCGFSLLLWSSSASHAAENESIANLPALGDAAQGLLPPAVETRLGERIMGDMRRQPEYLHDVLLRDYLQAIVQRLTQAADATAEPDAPHRFEVFVLRVASFNAFSLPGGYVGVHTGLVVDAQAEAQLAAVFAHELSHITQRHIAQRLAQAGTNNILSIGSLVLAILAGATGSGQAAEGLALGGQAAAVDRALRFSRNNERDADRVGTGILRASGYPPQAMASMLERLQNMSRLDNADVYAFLQDHPLTSERIADAQARGGDQPLPPDRSLRFWLMNARARVLTLDRSDAWRRQAQELATKPAAFPAQRAAWAYGQALALQAIHQHEAAALALQRAQNDASAFSPAERLPLDLAHGDWLLSQQQAQPALALARQLLVVDPASVAALHLQARALLALPDHDATRNFLREQTVLHPRDIQMWKWLAQAYAATGEFAAQHRATGEAYALEDNLEGAVLQLKIAQRTPGANYFEASIIDARLQVFQNRLRQDRQLDKLLPQ